MFNSLEGESSASGKTALVVSNREPNVHYDVVWMEPLRYDSRRIQWAIEIGSWGLFHKLWIEK